MSTITECTAGTKRIWLDGDTMNGRMTEQTTTAMPPPTESNDTNLTSLLDTRLEPIMDVIALQPKELQGTVITTSLEMLDLLATVKQRERRATP